MNEARQIGSYRHYLNELLQLRILCLGLLQDWDVGVGVILECTEVLCLERGQRARWGT